MRVLEDLDDRVDDHDRDLEALRSELRGLRRDMGLCRNDIGRLTDAMTGQTLVLGRVHDLMEKLLLFHTPSVVVSND